MGAGAPAYQVTKAALNAQTRTLAGELRRRRILVNAVCPGWIATEIGGAGARPVADGAAGIVGAAANRVKLIRARLLYERRRCPCIRCTPAVHNLP
jgi:NAD(P)-dependent dehydrogenase (short-subunit alcohol dehydrogenase family)